jgi:uncharacterized protein
MALQRPCNGMFTQRCLNISMLTLGNMVRRLPWWLEFSTILLLAFATPIMTSTAWMLYWLALPAGQQVPVPTDQLGLIQSFHETLMTTLVLAVFLNLRGWKLSTLGIVPTWRSTLLGIAGAAGLIALYEAVVYPVNFLFPKSGAILFPIVMTNTDAGLDAIIAFSLVNGTFEEVFVCGYLVRSLSPRIGMPMACIVANLIRASYHLYQGFFSALLILLMGFCATWWFVRAGKLFPVIVGHILLDVNGMAWMPSE